MTKAKIKQIKDEMQVYARTSEGIAGELLLDFADIVIWQLEEQKITQKDLADRVGIKESKITQIKNATGNPTFSTVGKIMNALGIEVNLVPKQGKPFEDKKRGNQNGEENKDNYSKKSCSKSDPTYETFEETETKKNEYHRTPANKC